MMHWFKSLRRAGLRSSRLLVTASILACGLAQAQNKPLVFGVIPYLSTGQIVKNLSPLRELLERTTGQSVTMVTAPNLRSFREDTRSGKYDIVFTAPHLGRLAQIEAGYQPVAMTAYLVSTVFVVPVASPVQTLADLRGKAISVPTSLAFIHLLAVEELRANGLRPGQEVELRESKDNTNTVLAMLHGDADAAATGRAPWSESPDKNKTRVIAESKAFAGLFVMAHPRIAPAVLTRLQQAFKDFQNTSAGRDYFALTRHQGFLPVDDATMKSFDQYTRIDKE